MILYQQEVQQKQTTKTKTKQNPEQTLSIIYYPGLDPGTSKGNW